MSQPQLSVREKAREMWAEFRKDKEKLNYILEKETLDFIDQIITLAQEEKIREIEKKIDSMKIDLVIETDTTMAVRKEYADPRWIATRNIALGDVIKILKQ